MVYPFLTQDIVPDAGAPGEGILRGGDPLAPRELLFDLNDLAVFDLIGIDNGDRLSLFVIFVFWCKTSDYMDLSFVILISATPRARQGPILSPAVLVLCLNLGRTYTFHCRRKSKSASKWLGFLVNVPFWSVLTSTLNQRVRISSLRRRTNPI
jgi:hypothetical protein